MEFFAVQKTPIRERFYIYTKNYWQGYFLAIVAFFLLISRTEISYYLFLYVVGFIFIQPFYQEKWNWLRKLLVAPLFSTAAVILLCAFSDLINLPVGVWCIYAVWFCSLLIVSIFPFTISVDDLQAFREYQFEIALTAIFILGLAARVLPVWNEAAPIFHDPVAHAAWAKDIIKTGHVNRFYSPGLHFSIAMATLTTNADLARNTLMLTQFFNGIIAVSASIFILEFSKRKGWAFLVAGIFAVGWKPASLYIIAGKNAFIFASAFLFFTWAVFYADIKKLNKIILCNAFLLTTILSHYPVAFICCLGILVIFLLTDNKKQTLSYLMLALIIGLLWGGTKLTYEIEKRSTSAQSMNINTEAATDILTITGLKEEVKSYANTIAQSWIVDEGNYASDAIFIISFLLMSFFGIKDRRYWFLPIFYIIHILLIRLGTIFRPINPVYIITSTQMIFGYSISYMLNTFSFSILLFDLWQNQNIVYKLINVAVVFMLVFARGFSLAKTYKDFQVNYHVVQKSDLEAFKWMREHLNQNDKILIDARIEETDYKKVVFAGDSGVWITIYTDFETSSMYEYGFSEDVYESTKLYLQFSEDPNNCSLRTKVLESGFKYYFRGSKQVHAQAMKVTSEAFDLIYTNGRVRIYRILPCVDDSSLGSDRLDNNTWKNTSKILN